MTPQEQGMIDGLINRIRNTQINNKDAAAEQRLQQGLAGFPDALYVLAQTVLVQQYGLSQAQAQLGILKQQVADLQEQLQTAQHDAQTSQDQPRSGGFLSHIFGGGSSAPAQGQQIQQPPYQPVNNPGAGNPNYGTPSYGSQPYPANYPPPSPYPTQAYPASGGFGGGGGGFLSGALQTAAGVAAGEAMFQGMESLFHGFEHEGGSGFTGGRGGETVVNNYYDDDKNRDRADTGPNDSGFYNPTDDASRENQAPQFADSGIGNDAGTGDAFSDNNDSGGFDDNSAFDSDAGFGDNSGFDDNSGGDLGGGGF